MDYSYKQKGFTLIELVIVLAICAVCLGGAIPSLNQVWDASNRRSAVNDLVSLINLARTTAIQEHSVITLCPLGSDNKCISDWNRPISVFRDPGRAKELTADSQLLRTLAAPQSGHLIVRSANRPYFQFQPTGIARFAIGNIIWCPEDNDSSLASQIRINMGGRPSISKDRDGDGVVEGSDGQPISCSA
ncbi:prepilin-type N-terminal cleavage/methylation domain-containing protein [Marinobacter salinexigens]|uniref:Type II secretion system protein H n=1 Tax=Marinobacter salinexigens TaxID=2919747 RepID=A0A5B0VBU7_9GAMM|nr:GspH/FimT family pseudopilin [Marinobacter salinexigens]KAA1171693.1 prepilin-type N-terminal cleavage/methylation domain-containing protein [Marinobacter salinexigens]